MVKVSKTYNLKKKLLLAGVAVLLAAAAVTGYSAYSRSNVPDLLSANVEALARGETHTTWQCDGSSKTKCKAHCGACGTSVSGTGELTGTHSCS